MATVNSGLGIMVAPCFIATVTWRMAYDLRLLSVDPNIPKDAALLRHFAADDIGSGNVLYAVEHNTRLRPSCRSNCVRGTAKQKSPAIA
jgi:hypothetical protein